MSLPTIYTLRAIPLPCLCLVISFRVGEARDSRLPVILTPRHTCLLGRATFVLPRVLSCHGNGDAAFA